MSKALFGRYQQAIPGEMTAAGRNAIYKLLEPNYGEYIARGTMYAAWAAGAAYGATKLYEAIAAGDSSGAQQSPGRR